MTDTDFERSPESTVQVDRPTPTIVVGIDDSAASQAALRWAAAQSRLTGIPLRVVHAWQMPELLDPRDRLPPLVRYRGGRRRRC